MENYSLQPTEPLPLASALPLKKKYSKVNEALRVRFIEFIVQDNMSIKEASLTLNINYSSAKAILAHHRKTLIHSNKITKNSQRAQFRALSSFDNCLDPIGEFICSTGGREVGRFPSQRHRPIVKVPIILQAANKDHGYLQNTSNSHIEQF